MCIEAGLIGMTYREYQYNRWIDVLGGPYLIMMSMPLHVHWKKQYFQGGYEINLASRLTHVIDTLICT